MKLKIAKVLTVKNKCFKMYKVRKGCETMEENELAIQNELGIEDIKRLIYTIRGKQVMLDSDVARLYNYQTKRINETVSRNKKRFPENFCFQLSEEEVKNLKRQTTILNLDQENNWSQIATSSKSENSKHRGKKYVPYVFTEQRIAMLSGLLKNDIAIQVSINIMNAFVEMRKFLMINGQVFERLTNVEYQLQEHNKKFDEVFNQLQLEENIKQRIFFDGQIYDVNNNIERLTQEIEETQNNLDIAIEDADEQYKMMKLRIQYMYERNEESFLAALLQSTSMGELLNRAEYYTKISSYDRQQLERYQSTIEFIKVAKQELEDNYAELDNLKASLEQQRTDMEYMLAEKQKEMQNLDTQIANAQNKETELASSISALDDEIDAMEKKLAAQEEEERRRQREREEEREVRER